MPSLEDVPTYLASTWDVPVIAAQAFLSIIVILAVLLPLLILTRGRQPLVYLVFFFLSEVFLVSVGWIDSWVMIATLIMAAMGVAWLGSKTVTGG